MDDLSISPEELENIVGGDSAQSPTPEPPAAETGGGDDAPLSQDDINRLLAEQTGGGAAPSTPAPSPVATQITPEELSKITGAQPISPATVSPAPAPSPAPQSSGVTARPAQFAPLQPAANNGVDGGNLDLLLGVNLRVTVELGRTRMSIEEILKLGPGSVVELDKLAGEPVDVLINDRLIARGEVVVIDDRFGVRITDVVPAAQRVHSMQ